MTHRLKIQRQWADAKLAGEKTFEIRKDDRGFQKGDTVRYLVVDPKTAEPWKDADGKPHKLESCEFMISYVILDKAGLEPGFCVYADQPVRPAADLARRVSDLEKKVESLMAGNVARW